MGSLWEALVSAGLLPWICTTSLLGETLSYMGGFTSYKNLQIIWKRSLAARDEFGKQVSKLADWDACRVAPVRAEERTNLPASETTCSVPFKIRRKDLSLVQQDKTKCPQNKPKPPAQEAFLPFHLYFSTNMSSYDSIIFFKVTNCIPCPLLHSNLLLLAAFLLGAFWFKLLFKLQTATEKSKIQCSYLCRYFQ